MSVDNLTKLQRYVCGLALSCKLKDKVVSPREVGNYPEEEILSSLALMVWDRQFTESHRAAAGDVLKLLLGDDYETKVQKPKEETKSYSEDPDDDIPF